jgi:RNA polymerase sigma-70 factor, ECF subfamily
MEAVPDSPTRSRSNPNREPELLKSARAGDEAAFEALVLPWRGRLLSFCYQMLGSVQDAEDALQDTMLRAWRGIDRFEGRSSVGSWLQTIATNRCLSLLERRRGRTLPVDHGPPAAVGEPSGNQLPADTWIDPLPEQPLSGEAPPEPAARYELRESVELAFIAAIQHLSPNERAALLLRDVFGFSAKETAAALDTTVASVTSALQRARGRIGERLPSQSQQAALRALGDERLTEIVERYGAAWEAGDVETVVDMLSEDARFAMPPLARWYRGREAISTFISTHPLAGGSRWRQLRVRANHQEALAFYGWDEEVRAFTPFALNVLDFEGEKISRVTAFVVAEEFEPAGKAPSGSASEHLFARFGLPRRLEP